MTYLFYNITGLNPIEVELEIVKEGCSVLDLMGFLGGLVEFVKGKVAEVEDREFARRVEGTSPGGDPTFGVDLVAEEAVRTFVEGSDLPLVYLTEDRGGVATSSCPRYLLVVDPIDGTRPAAAGMGTFCVSAALAPYSDDARMRDVTCAALAVFGEDVKVMAEKGGGALIERNGKVLKPSPARFGKGDPIFWSMGFVGRPSRLLVEAMGDLIDENSVRGGFFVLNSATYSATRILLGGFHAWVDVGKRIYDEVPALRERFLALSEKPLGLFPYDVAAIYLIFRESNLPCTDARGLPWDDISLLDLSYDNATSALLACSGELHEALLAMVDAGVRKLQLLASSHPVSLT